MRPTPEQPRPARQPRRHRFSGRGRVIAVVAVVVLILLIISLRGIARFYTDYLWFSSLHLTGVWGGVLGAKLALAAIFIAIFFGLMWTSLFVADRIAPVFGPGPEEELPSRYRELVGTRTGLVRVLVSLVFALIAGAGVSSQWKDWILFTNAKSFGIKDATYHLDAGFYVFRLPFLTFLGSWLFAAFVIILIVTTVAHYLNGGIRLQTPGPRVTPQVKAHLSVLLGILALIKGYQYFLQRYELVFSHRGTVDGSLYTDSNVELKALYLLMLISVFALGLFIVNIWRRGWVLPVLAVGLWALVAILAGALVPALVQRFRVKPAESSVERPYLRHNIAATRYAMGLDGIKSHSFASDGKLDARAITDNVATVRNIRLWDPLVMKSVFQKLQGLQPFYEINDADVDRYHLQGETTQVLVANRDLHRGGVPQKSWEATHLSYTHGYGMVMSPANASDAGQPKFSLRAIPISRSDGAPRVRQPDVYFGEGLSGYVMVNTGRSEVDFTTGSGRSRETHYRGKDGVKVGSGIGGFVNRASFALRYGDINPLISSNVRSGSKILLNRDVGTRLRAVAPFLQWDADPYAVALPNGRLVYLVDGYTTTNRFPNAERASTSNMPSGSGLRGNFNYVRNSVKAVVDAYDGTVKLYVLNDKDPLIRAYRSAFPELFTDGSKAPAAIRDHFRYPEDLFRVQTAMWGRYHLTNTDDFYNKNNAWDVARDPNAVNLAGNVTAVGAAESTDQPIDPYYLLMKLPDQKGERFLQLRPYVPVGSNRSRQQLVSFMVAQSDPRDYGQLDVYRMPSGSLPQAPANVAAQMQADDNVSRQQTLLCQRGGGSSCEFGNVLVIPIDNTLLYVRPFYVQSEGNEIPELKKVIVAYQNRSGQTQVAIDPTLYGALSRLFCPVPSRSAALDAGRAPNCNLPATRENVPRSSSPSAPPSGTSPPAQGGTGGLTGANAAQARALIQQLNDAVAKSKKDASKGDFAAFGKDLADIQSLTTKLNDLLASGSASSSGSSSSSSSSSSTTTSTTSPSATSGRSPPTTTNKPKQTTTTAGTA